MEKFEQITSRSNARLIRVRKIRDGKVPARIFIEGRRLVEESLRSHLVFEQCFVVQGFRDAELISLVSRKTMSIAELPPGIFGSISDTEHSQGIVIVAERPRSTSTAIGSRLEAAALPIVIYLKEINNPSNLGAILRTAEAADVAGVVVSKNSADVFSPKALRSAMGASFRLPVWEGVDFTEITEWAMAHGLTLTASDISATVDYDRLDWGRPRLLIFGSEAHGLEPQELDQVQDKIRIPMANGVESLNLAVSAGITLFEAKRQNS
ncbi:MAG: RNA methyltransferase [Pyrinomonadaceae bacterium]